MPRFLCETNSTKWELNPEYLHGSYFKTKWTNPVFKALAMFWFNIKLWLSIIQQLLQHA